MKTGDEQFDDLIRQKLDGSEVPPPASLFNQIVPEEKKKRGFLWLWLAGIGLIITSALLVHQQTVNHRTGNTDSLNQVPVTTNAIQIKSDETSSDKSINTISETKQILNAPVGSDATENGISRLNKANQVKSGDQYAENGSSYQNDVNTMFTPGVRSKKKSRKNKSTSSDGGQSTNANINFDQIYSPSSGLSSNVNLIHSLIYTPDEDREARKMETDKKQITEFNYHLPSKWAVEAGAGLIFSQEHLTTSSGDSAFSRLVGQMQDDMNIGKGWYVNAGMVRQLNEHFSVSITAGFKQIKGSSSTQFKEFYKYTEYDTISYPILFPFNPPLIVTNVDSTVISKTIVHPIAHRPVISSLTFGSAVHYTIPLKNLIIEPNAGFSIRLMQSIKGQSSLNTDFDSKNAEQNYRTSVSPSLHAGLNIGYSLSEKMSAFIQPSYEYLIGNQAKKEVNYKSEISNMKMGIGIRYTFFKKEATEITPMLSDN